MPPTIVFFLFFTKMVSLKVVYPIRNVKVNIYKTIILSVVLYGCETWSLTLREEHRVFENRVLDLRGMR
jgi:hypothetical protein